MYLEEMLLEEYSFGGEQSGHVIFFGFLAPQETAS